MLKFFGLLAAQFYDYGFYRGLRVESGFLVYDMASEANPDLGF